MNFVRCSQSQLICLSKTGAKTAVIANMGVVALVDSDIELLR
jgi:hypothetical protein